MSWREYWNADTPIYVNDRHKQLHYGLIVRDLAPYLPGSDGAVLDHGCGEALSADRMAERVGTLFLCDGAPLVRERLRARLGRNAKVRILSPEEVAGAIPDESIGLVVVNSLLQYLSHEDFVDLLALWHSKLAPDGRLVLGDVIPHATGPLDDVRALLGFAWRGGFLRAALVGLARTALSDYGKLRSEYGLTRYDEGEMLTLLGERGYAAERAATNIGHNPHRMTFVGRPA